MQNKFQGLGMLNGPWLNVDRDFMKASRLKNQN